MQHSSFSDGWAKKVAKCHSSSRIDKFNWSMGASKRGWCFGIKILSRFIIILLKKKNWRFGAERKLFRRRLFQFLGFEREGRLREEWGSSEESIRLIDSALGSLMATSILF